jgi:tetratricopeptide (TPR) repeat protein
MLISNLMITIFPSLRILIISIFLSLSISGCFSSRQLVTENAVGLFRGVSQSANRQSDIELVRQGLTSYLLLIDGMNQTYPDNANLLLAGAQAYSSYASLSEEGDASRTARLIQKAKDYALKALEQSPPFKGSLEKSLDLFETQVSKTEKNQVPLLFGVASIWGTWIVQGPDPVEGMADLPKVEALMDRVLQLDPGYYYGGAHLFKGILLSIRPAQFGGDLKKAEAHFQQALKYSQGKFLMTSVFFAQYYARQRLDRNLFVSTLKKVLSTPADSDPDLTLVNTLAHKKAQKLLDQVEDFF